VKPALAVDWDGTLVTDAWPEMGKWLPGARQALHRLVTDYEVYIWSCRTANAEKDDWDTPRPEEAEREVASIRHMLDDAGLQEVHIWQRDFKPPAVAYIDNKAVHFDGHWGPTLRALRKVVG
jgi:hypothetical protein